MGKAKKVVDSNSSNLVDKSKHTSSSKVTKDNQLKSLCCREKIRARSGSETKIEFSMF